MGWMAETFDRRADPRALMANAKSLVMLGLNYGPAGDPLATLGQKSAGAISVYARGRDYHDVIKGRLKELAAFLAAAARPEKIDVKVFVDTAPLDGEAARGAGRNRLAGQAHQPGVARIRLVAVPRRDPDRSRAPARRAGEPTIAGPAGPASTSARPAPFRRPTGSTPGAASPISRSSTRAPSRASFAAGSATAFTAATTASPSARGTSSPAQAARRSSQRAPTSKLRRSPNSPVSTTPGSARCFAGRPGQAARARAIPAQRPRRDRQLGRSSARRGGVRTARRPGAAGARRRRLGAGAIACERGIRPDRQRASGKRARSVRRRGMAFRPRRAGRRDHPRLRCLLPSGGERFASARPRPRSDASAARSRPSVAAFSA